MKSTLPIGIFDSGIGGLTVAKEIIKLMPNENIIYLGDTARVPYGVRDKKTISIFAKELTSYLLTQKVKVLVVACNTISAISLNEVIKASPVTVIGVINPTVLEAVQLTRTAKIGIIGTRATIDSKTYDRRIKRLMPKAKTISVSCPLFVPLAEEGFIDNKASKLIVNEYLSGFKHSGIDTLILGCTHYPILSGLIQKTVGKKILLIDSAKPTARNLKEILEENNLLNKSGKKPKLKFLVTDAPDRIFKIANLFFDGKFPGKLKKVNIFK